MRRDARSYRLDAVGIAIAGTLAGWMLLASMVSGGSAAGPIGVLLATVLAAGIARLIAMRWPAVPFVAVVVSTVILIASAWPDMTSDYPLAGPLGYQNANGAFAVQALVAAAILVAASTSHLARAAAIAAVALFAAVPFVIGSVGAAVSSIVVLAVGSLVILGWWRGWGTAALLGGMLAVLLGTVALGASYVPQQATSSGIVEEGFTETRLALWHDALAIAIAHPLIGVGPGRFIEVSQVASADPDTRHAHQEYLEMAAETGFVGGLLLVMLVGWAMIRTGRRGDSIAALAASAVAALAIHASVDYVMHFPIIPITTAVLVGAATASRRDRGRRRVVPQPAEERS